MKMLLATIVLCLACVGVTPAALQSLPPPPTSISVEITGAVSLRNEVPLKVNLFSGVDNWPSFQNYDFLFFLLDDHGQQVGGAYVFIREASCVNVDLHGRQAAYKPRLDFNLNSKGLVVGGRYQLVCAMPGPNLAGSAYFTLAK